MGMFDTVICDYPLPDCGLGPHEFQSKDLDCAMDVYRITSEGRLMHEQRQWQETPKAELQYPDMPMIGCIQVKPGSERTVDVNHSGGLEIYGDAGGFKLWFKDGKIADTIRIE